jgi:chromosome partitioning protein
VRIAEAPSHGEPVITYDPRSAGAEAYWKVAMELVERSSSEVPLAAVSGARA